jgi:hypothetical protein
LTIIHAWEAIKTAFERFKKNKKIVCASIPVVSSEGNSTTEQIQVWSKQVEQKSILRYAVSLTIIHALHSCINNIPYALLITPISL